MHINNVVAITYLILCSANKRGGGGGGGGVTTYIFLIRMYPEKTKGEPKAGAGFLANYQPKSGGKSYML